MSEMRVICISLIVQMCTWIMCERWSWARQRIALLEGFRGLEHV